VSALPHRSVTNATNPPRLRKPGRREEVAERRARAIALRRAGADYRRIGKELGVSQMQAWRDVAAALRDVISATKREAEELIALEADRLDALLLSCWRAALDGNTGAILVALRISESRRKLLGLVAEIVLPVPNAPTDSSRLAALDDIALAEHWTRVRHAFEASRRPPLSLPVGAQPGDATTADLVAEPVVAENDFLIRAYEKELLRRAGRTQ